jgi:tetratricopeptide (TPR) repeat protein
MQALERHSESVRAGDFATAEIAAFQAMCLAMEEHDDQSPNLLEQEVDRCEVTRDYAGLEAIWTKQVAVIAARGDTTCGLHMRLSSLYLSLNRANDALHQAELAEVEAQTLDVPFTTALVLKRKGETYLRLHHMAEAVKCFGDALRSLDPTDRLYDQSRASILISLAHREIDSENLDGAARCLDSAIELLRPREAMQFAAGVQMEIAGWYGATGRLRQKGGDIAGAVEAWAEAVERCRRVNSMPHCAGRHTALDLAHKLHHYGDILGHAGNHFDSQRALAESAAIICDLGLPPQQYD